MKLDRIAAAVCFLVGAVIVREGTQLTYMSGFSVGPGFFPFWLGLALMLLSAILFITTRAPNQPFIESASGFRKAAMVAVAVLVYVVGLSYLGLLLALAILLAFLVGVVERKSWRVWAPVALLGSLGCYLIFEVWLSVPLPIGVLGI
ncbi:MAG TPA: tripartite tricarboxylate transporter TctB family protein [Chloroflexota bacterium]|nr:tripartite tricarboxylate transporter TctB family protein [Chloroflexota bacterium]